MLTELSLGQFMLRFVSMADSSSACDNNYSLNLCCFTEGPINSKLKTVTSMVVLQRTDLICWKLSNVFVKVMKLSRRKRALIVFGNLDLWRTNTKSFLSWSTNFVKVKVLPKEVPNQFSAPPQTSMPQDLGAGRVVSSPDPTRPERVWWHSADSSGFIKNS